MATTANIKSSSNSPHNPIAHMDIQDCFTSERPSRYILKPKTIDCPKKIGQNLKKLGAQRQRLVMIQHKELIERLENNPNKLLNQQDVKFADMTVLPTGYESLKSIGKPPKSAGGFNRSQNTLPSAKGIKMTERERVIA